MVLNIVLSATIIAPEVVTAKLLADEVNDANVPIPSDKLPAPGMPANVVTNPTVPKYN